MSTKKTSGGDISHNALWQGNTSVQLPAITTAQLKKLTTLATNSPDAPQNPLVIISEDNRFGVEEAHNLQELVRDLLPNRQALIIIGYQLYSNEAQDTLLKLLEETPNHVTLCIVTTPDQPLLTTVQSRLFRLEMANPRAGNGPASSKNAPTKPDLWQSLHLGTNPTGLSTGQIRRLQAVLTGGSKLPQKWISDWISYSKIPKKPL